MADGKIEPVFTRFRWICWTILALFLAVGIDEVLCGRGGGRGGGSRSSSSRISYRSSSSARYDTYSTRVRVRYSRYNHPWRSWHDYGRSGHIYGFYFYTRTSRYSSNRDREPTICRNDYDNWMGNGTKYEWFICPSETSPDNYDSCCGDDDREHCCEGGLSGAEIFGIVVGVFVVLLVVILLIYCCCCKSRGTGTTIKTKQTAREMTHLVNPPVSGPNPTFPQNSQPMQPAYPPQPGPGYQNGNPPGAYPPYPPDAVMPPCPPEPNKLPYGVQPSQMNPDVGYPPYPPSDIAPPYPNGPDGYSAPPYPPYPTDGSSAPPYPPYPTDGSSAPPYPIDGSAGAPYPLYPTGGDSAPLYGPQPVPSGHPGYPGSPPPTYYSVK